jgi:hypothetical protein
MKILAKCTATFIYLASATVLADPPREQVEAGIERSVAFEIRPNAEGRIAECHLQSVTQVKTNAVSTFQPSQTFIDEACNVSLARGPNWIPEQTTEGRIKPVLETCMWSKAIPDEPICRVEVQARFADEIPNGIGYGAIFGLSTDAAGRISSCRFASMSSLSSQFVDIRPNSIFVSDACKKLSSVAWKPQSKEFFSYCRYIPENPARAFCEKRFGE